MTWSSHLTGGLAFYLANIAGFPKENEGTATRTRRRGDRSDAPSSHLGPTSLIYIGRTSSRSLCKGNLVGFDHSIFPEDFCYNLPESCSVTLKKKEGQKVMFFNESGRGGRWWSTSNIGGYHYAASQLKRQDKPWRLLTQNPNKAQHLGLNPHQAPCRVPDWWRMALNRDSRHGSWGLNQHLTGSVSPEQWLLFSEPQFPLL